MQKIKRRAAIGAIAAIPASLAASGSPDPLLNVSTTVSRRSLLLGLAAASTAAAAPAASAAVAPSEIRNCFVSANRSPVHSTATSTRATTWSTSMRSGAPSGRSRRTRFQRFRRSVLLTAPFLPERSTKCASTAVI